MELFDISFFFSMINGSCPLDFDYFYPFNDLTFDSCNVLKSLIKKRLSQWRYELKRCLTLPYYFRTLLEFFFTFSIEDIDFKSKYLVSIISPFLHSFMIFGFHLDLTCKSHTF